MSDENDEDPKPVYWAGPWHFVQATIDADEMWGVNGVPTRISNGNIVPFMLSDSAAHFVNQRRAIDLGVWNSFEELQEAFAREQAKQEKAAAKRQEKANGKEPHPYQAGKQGKAAEVGRHQGRR